MTLILGGFDLAARGLVLDLVLHLAGRQLHQVPGDVEIPGKGVVRVQDHVAAARMEGRSDESGVAATGQM